MLPTKAYAAFNSTTPLAPWNFERRNPGPNDVQIQILFCGVCHTDIHQARNEWGGSVYPLVPGHEIIGRVIYTGNQVQKFKPGDFAGVGVFVNSCRVCSNCKKGLEQYCKYGAAFTYNSTERDGKTRTYGGYSNQIVIDENYVLHISDKLDLEKTAPLLCAGITTYSPLRNWEISNGHKVGVMGLGGLGHMAVKFAVSFGAEVSMLSTSPSKEADAKRLGVHKFILTIDENEVNDVKEYFDFIIDTVSAPHSYDKTIKMLNTDGTLICVGIPPEPMELETSLLIGNRRRVAGSMIGGIAETQEMLDYCAEKNITSDVEVISINKINEAYDRMLKSDVRYRFVIDMATL